VCEGIIVPALLARGPAHRPGPRCRQLVGAAQRAHPVWIEVRADICHVREVNKPPGDRAQLVRSRPASSRSAWRATGRSGRRWSCTNAGSARHVAKVHHCLVDGVAGVDLLAALLDLAETPWAAARGPAPPPMPSADRLFFDAFFDAMADRCGLADSWRSRWPIR
jgi:hypothetical protein